ncbi:MAG: polysaccharide deacetylase family protein [Nitrospinae bacterium]|nr:polysaccharide deacetylase family protein [Nitrospinota bacterium]
MANMYLTITIDTENPYKDTPMEDWIYCNFNGECFGIERIMDILDRHGVKGTFFVDVYERYNSGNEKIADVCRLIDKKGHDVELHTHPVEGNLSDMPFEKQRQFISDGVKFLSDVLNKKPIAHRAGSYMANLDTLKALKENGILIDSSNFFEVSPLGITKNRVVFHACPEQSGGDGVLEIPVTYFHVPFKPLIKLMGRVLGRRVFYNGNCKYDINWCSLYGLKSMIERYRRADVRIVNLFMHSFSFIDEERQFINIHDLKKFEEAIAYLKNLEGINFITMREAATRFQNDLSFKEYILNGSDKVPLSLFGVDLHKLIRRKYV